MESTIRTPGYFIFSIDVEAMWGFFYREDPAVAEARFADFRGIFQRLVGILDRYRIAATFAFVGHLLLSECSCDDGIAHPEVLCPDYEWYPGHWHAADPCTSVEENPAWYGSDLLAMVRDADMPHEVGCHTFSHIMVGDPACSREILLSQLRACRTLHEDRGLPFTSFVYPRNECAYMEAVAEAGLRAYRGPERTWYTRLPGKLQRAGHLLHRLLAIAPPVYDLPTDTALPVDVPASMLLYPRGGIRNLVPLSSRRLQAYRGLQRAAAESRLFHLWLHPHNFIGASALFGVLEAILRRANELRARGSLRSLTMAQYVDLTLRGSPPPRET